MDDRKLILEENLKKESFEKEEFLNKPSTDEGIFDQEPIIENEKQQENIIPENSQITNQTEEIECQQFDSINQNEKLSFEKNFIPELIIEEKKKENLISHYVENGSDKLDTERKASASFSREFLTKENVISLLNLDASAENRHEINDGLQQDLQTSGENTQKPKFSLVKQLKLSLNRKNSDKKSGEIKSHKFFKKSSLFKNSIEKKDDQTAKINETIYDDYVEKKTKENDSIIESLNESNKEIDMENTQFKIFVNSQDQESDVNRKKSSLKNFELNFDPSFNRGESDISVSCQLFHSDKNLKKINDLKIKNSISSDENQDFLFIHNETKEKFKKDLLIYKISEINSIDHETLSQEVLDTFFELNGENLGQYLTKIESTAQLKSNTIELCDHFSSKNEDILNFQIDFLEESYNIDDDLNQDLELSKKISTPSFFDQIEQKENDEISKSMSALISDNEIVFSEIEKKSQIFHSKNYYHLIDKGDLDQSDDQSNYRKSEIITQNFENQMNIEQNHNKLRLSYSCTSLSKNTNSLSNLKEENKSFLNIKTFSFDKLSKRSSKSSNISANESLRFYCLLKYRIKHLLKKSKF